MYSFYMYGVCISISGGFTARNVVIILVSWIFATLDMSSDWANYNQIVENNATPSTDEIDYSNSSLGI